MQRMEVIIRYVGDEDQVLSESNMSSETLDIDSIPRGERLDQLESDTLGKGHEIRFLRNNLIAFGASSHKGGCKYAMYLVANA